MNLQNIRKLTSKAQLPVLAGMILVFGLFAVVAGTQQRQDTRSRASGTGGTGNCLTVNASTDDLIADDCYVPSGFNGSIFGNRNTIGGALGGSIYGNNNIIQGGMNGCINGNNNEIFGGVNGGVVGTGNIIHGGQGDGPCPDPRLITPTSTPPATPTPTTRPFGTCKDGIDNNQNELIDIGDPVCHTDGNPNNPGSYDPYRNEVALPTPTPTRIPTPTPTRVPATCSDGLDNNQNELIDGADPICHTDGNANNPGSFDPQRSESTVPTVGPTTTPTPTVTIAPGNTSISLNLLLHGIGRGGDSANPQSGGNPNPLRPQRTATVEVYNGQNQLITTKQGGITFNSTAGNFTGTVDLGAGFSTGVYTIKVKTSQFLKTLVPGIQNLTQGTVNQLPVTIMVNGDIDGNNTLNILDYNILMGCYSDFLPAPSCTALNKPLSDLDDDGDVNQFDYNLFLREITNREGQ